MKATGHRRRPRAQFITEFSAIAASIAFVRAPASAAEFSWKYGHDLTADHPINVRSVEAFAKIRAETNGRLDIKAYPNSVLGGDPAMVTQLRSGALEMMAESGGVLDSVVPLAAIENLAFAFNDRATVFAAMDGDLGKIIRDALAASGIIVVGKIFENGFRQFTTSTKPIKTVADLEGLRMRASPGQLRIDTFRSLGASPTPISASDLYTALQTHVVDAQETSLLYVESQRYYEVQRYCSLTRHMWSGFWPIVNEQKWRELPASMQDAVRKHMDQAVVQARLDDEILERSVRDKLARQGMLINTPEPRSFREKLAAASYYARWKAKFGDAAWSAVEKYAGALT